MQKIMEKIKERFGNISSGHGLVICTDSQNNLIPYGDPQRITARDGSGAILDSRLKGASLLFGGSVYAVFRQDESEDISVEQFDGNNIFHKIN